MAVTNREASLLARLKNKSQKDGLNFQVCLQLFVQEEFLRRLAESEYKSNLILKGGMFIYTLTECRSRPTRDIDFSIRHLSDDLENTSAMMQKICNVRSDNDFVKMNVLTAERILTANQYPGARIRLMSHIGNVRIPFSIDVGTDNVIVPAPSIRKITAYLDGFREPEIYTYSLESTIAEKFDAILLRMETTSRMKDFYDIYYLSGTFDFNGKVLREAVKKTMEHRGRRLPDNVYQRILGFADSRFFQIQWKAFSRTINTEIELETVLRRLVDFMRPITDSITADTVNELCWNADLRQWKQIH